MELLKWELRKIWRPGILAAILLLCRRLSCRLSL